MHITNVIYESLCVYMTYLNKQIERSYNKHLLEVGVFGVLDQLQQNSLCGCEESSTLLQSGQSKQTVCLAVEGSTKVCRNTLIYSCQTHKQ